jgi:hypothetical protein
MLLNDTAVHLNLVEEIRFLSEINALENAKRGVDHRSLTHEAPRTRCSEAAVLQD